MHELFVILDHTVTALALSLRPVPGKTVDHCAEVTTLLTINLDDEPGDMLDALHWRDGSERNPDWEISSNLVSTIGLLLDTLERQGNPVNGTPSVLASPESLFPDTMTQTGKALHQVKEGLIGRPL